MRKRLCSFVVVLGIGSQLLGMADAAPQQVRPTALDQDDFFGQSVDVDGAMAAVGAPGSNSNAGSAFVYANDGAGSWNEVATIAPPSGFVGTRFGERVAIDGTTIVVGTGGADVGTNTAQGSAYVFQLQQSGTTWTASLKATLRASDGAANDRFGHAVDVDGDTVVVGAPLRDDATYGADRGGSYVFVRPANGRRASATNEYIPQTNQTLTFAAGERTKTVTIQVRGDRRVEPDERFLVDLSAPTNATIVDGRGAGTIVNDD